MVDGKSFRLADKVHYIQRRAAEHDERIVTVGQLVFFSTETGDAWLLDTLDHLAARLTRDGDPEPIDIEFLLPCFVRYPPVEVCLDLSSRGTVIDGRTGSGKTAILKYILSTVEHASEIDPFDMSMSYVSNSDVLSFLYAIGADLDLLFQVL